MSLRNTSVVVALPIPDDLDWAERSEYWRTYLPVRRGRRKKYRYREPLFLCGHGINIRIDHNTLLVRNGFTHYPQKAEQLRFFPGDPNLPDRIIILDASGAVSFDALSWMSDQKIALVQLDWRGRVSFSGNSGFAANPKLVRWQTEIQGTLDAQKINRRLIAAKFDASIETLKNIFHGSEASVNAIQKIRALKSKIQTAKPGSVLGYEGAAAAIYYSTWHGLPLQWSGLWKRPIPASWAKIGSRQMAWRKDANLARHPVNAMLNYGYGVLIGQVQTEIITAGFDPSIGITHKRWSNRIPLVYDLMEPLRPVVDQIILEFALSQTFTPGDFTINSKGGCRLNPQMAKTIVRKIADLEAGSLVRSFLTSV